MDNRFFRDKILVYFEICSEERVTIILCMHRCVLYMMRYCHFFCCACILFIIYDLTQKQIDLIVPVRVDGDKIRIQLIVDRNAAHDPILVDELHPFVDKMRLISSHESYTDLLGSF